MKTATDMYDIIADEDVAGLRKAQQSYGDSWKRRGGVGAYMMLARKWDRLEKRCGEIPTATGVGLGDRFDIFKHVECDQRSEGIIDDIRDLRRYLILVVSHMRVMCSTMPGRSYEMFLETSAENMMSLARAGLVPKFGGVGMFIKLSEQWDKLERIVSPSYDIFRVDAENVCFSIGAYLAMVEHAFRKQGINPGHRDNDRSSHVVSDCPGICPQPTPPGFGGVSCKTESVADTIDPPSIRFFQPDYSEPESP